MRFPWGATARRVRQKPLLQVPFIGHDAVLATLAAHLQAAQDGTVQCVALMGETGSGKTALLEEFVFLHCNKPNVLLIQTNAAACLLTHEFYRQLCFALQKRSEHILQTVYKATQRLQKTLSLQWDEVEFRHLLASTEWGQFQTSVSSAGGIAGRSATPFAQLLHSVQEHPWAMGAAAVLSRLERRASGTASEGLWEQRWLTSLRAIAGRYRPGNAVLVVLIEQVTAPCFPASAVARQPDWQAFTAAMTAAQLPVLLVWAGSDQSLTSVQQAMPGAVSYTQHRLEPLSHEMQQRLLQHTIRALPRTRQGAWQQALMSTGEMTGSPGWLLLATANAAALQTRAEAGDEALAILTQSDTVALVRRLVEHIREKSTVPPLLWQQSIDLLAFMPPRAQFVVDDILPWYDFTRLDVTIAAGRAHLEAALGQCVRYGLLYYDAYAARYTLGHSALQEALQCVAHPEEIVRRQMARQWALATAILRHVQQGERVGLAEVARLGREEYGEAMGEILASTVLETFRRLLPMSTKDERQRMAHALGGFPAGLAVDMLRLLLQDEDGQVRSSAVQSLADLAIAVTLPGLLDALKDRNSDVRWIATQALGQMPGMRAVDALIPMLTDEDKEVGRIAAQGLGQQGDSRAVPHLIAATRDSYPLLRESAISALGQLADRRAIPALQEVLQDANPQIRRSAEKALARFTASSGG